MPGELNELSIRHHHFSESDAESYDGIVRVQSIEKPIITKSVIFESNAIAPSKIIVTTVATLTGKCTPFHELIRDKNVQFFIFPFVECPSNTTLAATRPQQNAPNMENNSENRSFHIDSFLRHLTSSQFHTYSAALAITIGVGCFLLLLNILIFAGIYYQRVKRTLDAKRKEAFVESGMMLPNFIDRCMEKSAEKNSLNMSVYSADLNYEEYNRYVEKAMHCGLPIENHKCKSKESRKGFVRIPAHSSNNCGNDMTRQSTYPSSQLHSSLSEANSSDSSDMVTYKGQQIINKDFINSRKLSTEQCNQSTQSEFRNKHDVGTTVTENDVDDRQPIKIDDNHIEKVLSTPSSLRSSISTSNYHGGILRQQLGPNTPSTSKKRVQIQEISV